MSPGDPDKIDALESGQSLSPGEGETRAPVEPRDMTNTSCPTCTTKIPAGWAFCLDCEAAVAARANARANTDRRRIRKADR